MEFGDVKHKVSEIDQNEFESYRQVAEDYLNEETLGDSLVYAVEPAVRYMEKLRGALGIAKDGEEMVYGITEMHQNQFNLSTMEDSNPLEKTHNPEEFERVVETTLGQAYREWVD